MRTSIVLDDALLTEAMRLARTRTKRDTVQLALSEFVARHRQREILKLVGEGLIAPDYDVRVVRERMSRGAGR